MFPVTSTTVTDSHLVAALTSTRSTDVRRCTAAESQTARPLSLKARSAGQHREHPENLLKMQIPRSHSTLIGPEDEFFIKSQ